MKFLITEDQLDLLKLEKQSDILSDVIKSFYPDVHENHVTWADQTEVLTKENGEALFVYDWEEKIFFVGFIKFHNLFKVTGLPFLNYHTITTDESEKFEELMKVFAKRHYGWDVKTVRLEAF